MKRIVSIVLSLSLIISFSIPAYAQESTNPEEEITRIREEVELREPNADTYLLSDGSYECVVYSDNKYFENDNGKLIEIDNSIVNEELTVGDESYAYANKANSTKVYFSNSKPAVYIESKGRSLSFEMVDAQASEAIPGGDEKMEDISDFGLTGENYITYKDIKPQTDLVYEIKNGLLKEFIVLKDSSAPNEFSFKFDTNYIFENSKDGNVIILDENGEALFELGDLFAVDSAEAYTDDLEYTITESDDCKIVTVSISPEYLNAPERAFPVLIDPSITYSGELDTIDAYVSSKNASTNYGVSTYLKTGRSAAYYVTRSYIKFKIPTSILYNQITASTLRIKKRGGVNPTSVKARRITSSWTSSGVKWSNKPSTATTGFTLSLDSDDWYSAIVTTIVKKWSEEGKENFGFELRDNTETGTDHWTTYYSSDASYPNRPELHINYNVKNVAQLVAVTHENGYDRTSWLNPTKTYLESCHISSANKHIGYYTKTQIKNYLNNNENCVFISRSHGKVGTSGGEVIYTGIAIDTSDSNNWIYFLSNGSTEFSSVNLSNMKLIVFAGCSTGAGGPLASNLLKKCVDEGAITAVGFKSTIKLGPTNQWVKDFSRLLKNGYTVLGACLELKDDYESESGLKDYVISGSKTTKLVDE